MARIRAQPHGAAQFVDALQLAQLVNHAMRRGGIEFGGIGVLHAAHVARDIRSPSSACPRQMPKYGTLCSRAKRMALIMPSMPRLPNPPGTRMPSYSSSFALAVAASRDARPRSSDVDLHVVRQAAVQQRFLQALVGILVLDVFAHQPDDPLRRADSACARAWRSSAQIARAAASRFSRRRMISSTPCFGEHQRESRRRLHVLAP